MVKQNREQIISDILDAVIKCRYENNSKNIQMTQIAARAGISTRTLNRYFADKEKMFYESSIRLLTLRYKDFNNFFYTLDLSGMNGRAKLIYILKRQIDYFMEDTRGSALFVEASIDCIENSLKYNTTSLFLGQEVKQLIISIIKTGMEDGSVRKDISSERLALVISSVINGLMQRLTYMYKLRLKENTESEINSLFAICIDMIDDLLKPRTKNKVIT